MSDEIYEYSRTDEGECFTWHSISIVRLNDIFHLDASYRDGSPLFTVRFVTKKNSKHRFEFDSVDEGKGFVSRVKLAMEGVIDE